MERRVTPGKKEKANLQEFEGQIKEIRAQFTEQLRCLSERTDTQTSVIGELQEFYRRRADLEAEHGKNLDKLARSLRHKGADKHKRESWQLHSMHQIWQDLLEDTKSEARQRASLADLYSNHVVVKLGHHAEDVQKVARKCRDIGSAGHAEISRVLNELHTAMKTYQLCYAQSSAVEAKFRVSEQQKLKYEEANPSKVGSSRKYRVLEKDFDKRHGKYQEFRLKALKARNEYLLCVDAANAALHKYFADDLPDLIDCMDLGMTHWLSSLVSTVVSARKAVCQSEMDGLAELAGLRDSLDDRADKQRFLEAQPAVFMLPRRFDFRPHMNDTMRQLSAQKSVQDELIQRYLQIEKRLVDLKTESEEVWKTLETAEAKVLQLQTEPIPAIEELFSFNMAGQMAAGPAGGERKTTCRQPDALVQKRKLDLAEIEDFYLEKFQNYLLNSNLIKRLQARSDLIRKALGGSVVIGPCGDYQLTANHNGANGGAGAAVPGGGSVGSGSSGADYTNGGVMRPATVNYAKMRSESVDSGSDYETAGVVQTATTPESEAGHSSLQGGAPLTHHRPPTLPPKPRKRRIGAANAALNDRRPRLFAGSLEEYVEATGEDIPLVVWSCIRMLSQYALHHQGVFRVSGSQLEINALKDAFEKGEDPLVCIDDSNLVNPVAGVLKLYFRELRGPLFPIFMFDQFTDAAKIANKRDFVVEARHLIASLPKPVILVMRYLFAFLNHLSEFSDENMMDPYNLAVCFGPTLIPIPDGKDQVFYHNHVNEFTKNLIIYYEEIFPWDLPGPVYEKFLMCSVDDGEDLDPTLSSLATTTSSSNAAAATAGEERTASVRADERGSQSVDDQLSTAMRASLIGSLPNVDDDDVEDGDAPPVACSSPFPVSSPRTAARLSASADDAPPPATTLTASLGNPPSPAPVAKAKKASISSTEDPTGANETPRYSRLEDYVSDTVIRRHPHVPSSFSTSSSSRCSPPPPLCSAATAAVCPPSSPPPASPPVIVNTGGGIWVKRDSFDRSKEYSILTPKEKMALNYRDVPPPCDPASSIWTDGHQYSAQFRRQGSLTDTRRQPPSVGVAACYSPPPTSAASVGHQSNGANRLSLQATTSEHASAGGTIRSGSNVGLVSPVGGGGLSPTSLHEIQTELKAVLTSLEQFSMKNKADSGINSGASSTAAAKDESYKPDLVRNLPLLKNGTVASPASVAAGASPTGSSGSDESPSCIRTAARSVYATPAVTAKGPAPVPPKKPTVIMPQATVGGGWTAAAAPRQPSRTSSSEGSNNNYEVIGKF